MVQAVPRSVPNGCLSATCGRSDPQRSMLLQTLLCQPIPPPPPRVAPEQAGRRAPTLLKHTGALRFSQYRCVRYSPLSDQHRALGATICESVRFRAPLPAAIVSSDQEPRSTCFDLEDSGKQKRDTQALRSTAHAMLAARARTAQRARPVVSLGLVGRVPVLLD